MIPTYEAFTTKVGGGPKINRVSEAINAYWTNKGGRTLDEQVVALKMLIDAGKAWIKAKDGKSEFKKNFLGQRTGNINQRYVNRRTEVANLVEEATKELMGLLRANDLLTTDMRGQLTFDLRKFRQKGKLKLQRHQTKSLSHGYEQERESWVKSGKTKAISGTLVHGYTGEMNWDGFQFNELAKARRMGLLTSKIQKSVERVNRTGGTTDDWLIFSELERAIGDMRVLYLKKSQRYRHMVFIEDGLLVAAEGGAVDTSRLGNGFVWVMDQYGNMYVYPHNLGGYEISQVNHSTMNSGREVICAGMIFVRDGKVTAIDNASGHYKPTKEHLVEALTILSEEGLDMSELEVKSLRFPGPGPGLCYWDFYEPGEFVRTRGQEGLIREEIGPAV